MKGEAHMCAPRRDESGKVRFGFVEEGFPETAGVRLPKFGIFLSPDGEVILIALDSTPFRRFTAGLAFTKREARRMVRSPAIMLLTTEVERQELYRQIAESPLPRRTREPLERAMAEFERPMWGWCPDGQHLHVYLRGDVVESATRPERRNVRSTLGAGLLLLSLLSEQRLHPEDFERLAMALLIDPRFLWMPWNDPPKTSTSRCR